MSRPYLPLMRRLNRTILPVTIQQPPPQLRVLIMHVRTRLLLQQRARSTPLHPHLLTSSRVVMFNIEECRLDFVQCFLSAPPPHPLFFK